jgi:hypothetical protein
MWPILILEKIAALPLLLWVELAVGLDSNVVVVVVYIITNPLNELKVVASQDWPEVTKYAGLVSAQSHRQELIEDLYNVTHDPQKGTVCGGMVR